MIGGVLWSRGLLATCLKIFIRGEWGSEGAHSIRG